MNRRRLILTTLAVALLLINGFLWWRMHPKGTGIRSVRQGQAERILEWESQPVVPLTASSADLREVLEAYPRADCCDMADVSRELYSQLSPRQAEDLFSTIVDLLKCYKASTAPAILSYMEGRNEMVPQTAVDLLRKSIVDGRLATREEVAGLGGDDLVKRLWDAKQYESHWEGIVKNAGCMCLWRCEDPKEQRPVGKYDKHVFGMERGYRHWFQPDFTFANACKVTGGALVADVKVMVQHDAALKMERCPYFLRYWYSEKDSRWHPLHMSRVGTTQSQDVFVMF